MFESNREILTLCYDSVEEVRDGFYCVSNKGLFGVVDAGNNIVIPIKYIGFEKSEAMLIMENNSHYDIYSTVSFKQFETNNMKGLSEIKPLTKGIWLVTTSYREKGLVDDTGTEILPCIYRDIWKLTETSMHRIVKAVPIQYINWDSMQKFDVVYIDKISNRADCLFAQKIEGAEVHGDIQIVATAQTSRSGYIYEDSWTFGFRYKLRYNRKIIGNEYDNIVINSNLLKLGLYQTVKYNSIDKQGHKGTTTGLARIDTGEEIIKVGKYSDIQLAGNGIVIVKGKEGYGTVVDGHEVMEVGSFDSVTIAGNIPINIGTKGNKQYNIGNDGKGYERIEEAFPIYQNSIDSTTYLMNLYGNWVFVSSELKIKTVTDSRLKTDMSLWRKMA